MTTLSLTNLPVSITRKAKASGVDISAYKCETMCGRFAVAIHGDRSHMQRTLQYVMAYASKLGFVVDDTRWSGGLFIICLVDQGC